MSAGLLLSRLGHREDQGSQQEPGRSCWSPSPTADVWVCSSLWALLAGPGHPTELCSTTPPPGPCSAFVDQSLWVYPEIIKIPMFKPLKLWQWKPLMHLTGLCFWSGRFGGSWLPGSASSAITFSLWPKRMNISMLNQTATETLCL